MHKKSKTVLSEFGALTEEFVDPYSAGELTIKKTFYIVVVKRLIDIIISAAALIVTAPINIVIAIITLINPGIPIIFSHHRPGLAEKPIKIVKFRNMTNETDENGDLLPPEQRVTKVGRILRKTSLDELLQFGLIFIGKMSIIGPRPLLMSYLPKYTLDQHRRHSVKPGLECPMPDYSGEITWEQRIDNDLWYVDNISFKTDCIMFIRLIKLIFNRKRAANRGEKIDKTFGESD